MRSHMKNWGPCQLPDTWMRPSRASYSSATLLSSVQSLSHVRLFATPWIAAPGLPVHHQLPEFTQTHAHWVGNAIQPSHPISSPSPPAHNPSSIRVFSNESAVCMRRPKYWSFSFSISPSNEHPGLISFRTDWLDFLVVQGILKSLLQYHSLKASIFWCSAFFTVQTNPHGTEKNHYSHNLLKISSHRIIKINGYFKTLGNLFPSKS